MRKHAMTVVVGGVLLGLVGAVPAGATIIGVSDLAGSSEGTFASIIAAPSAVLNDDVTNTGQQGFDEQQNVLVPLGGLAVDGGVLAAGTYVDSHMIFLNRPDTLSEGTLTHHDVVWTFSGNILGVMSDIDGDLEFMSTPLLGALGTDYPNPMFNNRGFEGADSYLISGNQLTVNMNVTQPGDWIRVVTEPVPEPTTLVLLGGGLMGLALRRRRSRS